MNQHRVPLYSSQLVLVGHERIRDFSGVIKPSTSSPIGLFEYHSANSVTIPLHALASFLSLQYVFCLCSPPVN
jgi:hypothetical protein